MDSIKNSFSRYSKSYDFYAKAQKTGALFLKNEMLEDSGLIKNRGRIVEIGCGTGFLSLELAEIFKGRQLFFSDISYEMVLCCRKKLLNYNFTNHKYFVWDGNNCLKKDFFSIIVSSFTLQWFMDYIKSLQWMYESLVSGGKIFLSFQGPDSFPEWKEAAIESGVGFSGNKMPDPLVIEKFLKTCFSKYEIKEEKIKLKYSSSLDFFKSLKYIGAGFNTADKGYRAGDFLRLLKYWDKKSDGNIEVTYSVFMVKGEK